MIRPYDVMVHGVKEYKQLAEKKVANSHKSQSMSTNSYIDSCLTTTFGHSSKRLMPCSTKVTFGVGPSGHESMNTNKENGERNGWTCGADSRTNARDHT